MGSGKSSTSSGGGRPFAWAAAAVAACLVVNAMPNLRPTSPVGNSVQAAEKEYEVSRGDSHDAAVAVKDAATKLAAGDTTPSLISTHLTDCCTALQQLRDCWTVQTERKDVLAKRSRESLDAWKSRNERLQNASVRILEDNKLVAEELRYRQILREADNELALLQRAIEKGRDVELLAEIAEHSATARMTTDALAELSYEVSQKARTFGQQVTDFLASWR